MEVLTTYLPEKLIGKMGTNSLLRHYKTERKKVFRFRSREVYPQFQAEKDIELKRMEEYLTVLKIELSKREHIL